MRGQLLLSLFLPKYVLSLFDIALRRSPADMRGKEGLRYREETNLMLT